MPSFISNFKERLRLPRLFFRKPSRAEQIHGGPPLEFERPIPPIQWRGITVVVVLVVAAASIGWELYCRSLGYGPTLNDNEDLWTSRRRAVAPESIVVIGDSRAWFDVDLDEIQRGLGKRHRRGIRVIIWNPSRREFVTGGWLFTAGPCLIEGTGRRDRPCSPPTHPRRRLACGRKSPVRSPPRARG